MGHGLYGLFGNIPVFFLNVMEHFDADKARGILSQAAVEGSCQKIDLIPDNVKEVFLTSGEMSVESHVDMQSALQDHVDNSISKTINMPEEATVEDVETAYERAWSRQCKGITVYRTNSRKFVVLEKPKQEDEADEDDAEVETKKRVDEARVRRPSELFGRTMNVETPIGVLFATVNEIMPGQPFEVFLNASKAGNETAAITEAIGRLCSYVLRVDCEVPTRDRMRVIVQQMQGIGGGRSVGRGPTKVLSLPDGVARMLRHYLDSTSAVSAIAAEDAADAVGSIEEDQWGGASASAAGDDNAEDAEDAEDHSELRGDLCPDCGNPTYVKIEGCTKCIVCGRSEC